jgi:hypothetical protein
MPRQSKDQQVKHVVEGLALGVLAQDVEAVTSAKMELEFAFNSAWRKWSRASEFPNIGGHDPGNVFWIGMGRSETRRGVGAAWARGQWSKPYILRDGWSVADCLDLHADERASAGDWTYLGRLFIEGFNPDKVHYAGS